MAFRRCPDCGAEWWNEETCTDCGATLVDIPEDGDDDDGPRGRSADRPPQVIDLDDLPRPRLARFLGFFVDYVILTLALVALGALTGDSRVRTVDGHRVRENVLPPWLLVAYGIFILLYPAITVARMQRTPGMVVAGVGVEQVRADGSVGPVSWSTATIRGVIALGWFAIPPLVPQDSVDGSPAKILSWIVFLWPFVVFAPILVDPDRRGLHDLLLRTRVVRRAAPQWASGLGSFGAGRRARNAED